MKILLALASLAFISGCQSVSGLYDYATRLYEPPTAGETAMIRVIGFGVRIHDHGCIGKKSTNYGFAYRELTFGRQGKSVDIGMPKATVPNRYYYETRIPANKEITLTYDYAVGNAEYCKTLGVKFMPSPGEYYEFESGKEQLSCFISDVYQIGQNGERLGRVKTENFSVCK